MAGENGRHNKGYYHGNEMDAALDGRVAFDGLEPDGKEVHWRSKISAR